jgi:hypothetical protein
VAAIDLPLWLFYRLEYRKHFSACKIGKVECFIILTRHYKFLASSVCIPRFELLLQNKKEIFKLSWWWWFSQSHGSTILNIHPLDQPSLTMYIYSLLLNAPCAVSHKINITFKGTISKEDEILGMTASIKHGNDQKGIWKFNLKYMQLLNSN